MAFRKMFNAENAPKVFYPQYSYYICLFFPESVSNLDFEVVKEEGEGAALLFYCLSNAKVFVSIADGL